MQSRNVKNMGLIRNCEKKYSQALDQKMILYGSMNHSIIFICLGIGFVEALSMPCFFCVDCT